MSNSRWENNCIQFPRLLAEIRAVGLTNQQVEGLCDSMDVTAEELDSLFDRADEDWEAVKAMIRFSHPVVPKIVMVRED